MKTVISAAIILVFCIVSPLTAEIIHVPDDEPTIQDAADRATFNDTILVADGVWDGASIEGLLITVRSENGPEECIIDHTGYGLDIMGSGATIDGFTITGDGYGFIIADGPTTITNCLITENTQGGILIGYSETTISNCEISWNVNDNEFGGGGIHAWGDFTVVNCLFHHNAAWSDNPGVHGQGGAIWCTFSTATITNCTFHSNYAENYGGAIASSQDHAPNAGRGSEVTAVENCILWGNIAEAGTEETYTWDSSLEISYSTVAGGQSSCSGSFSWGDGMIEADPLFTTGPFGDYCLSQVAAGQAEDSPCVDTGNPATPLFAGTTRTDNVNDEGIIDMGYHYPEPRPTSFLVTGPGPFITNPPLVRVFPPAQDATHIAQWPAYGADSFGVNVTTGDLDGDGASEIVTGAGPGPWYGPHVRAFTPGGETVPGLSFLAYGTNKNGVNVACGDIDGDGRDELVTGAGPSIVFGPHVRGWDYDGSAVTPISGVSYFAYGTPRWGANVAAGDIDGDGVDEIVTGPGPGLIYGPHVRGWDVDGGVVSAISAVSYLAYGTNIKGVRVTCGDVDGDGIDEIVTAPGPALAFGAHIRGWDADGGEVVQIPGINFFAWDPSEGKFGATVSALVDLNGDGRTEMVCGQGPEPSAGTPLKVFSYDGDATTLLFDFDGYGDLGLTQGINGVAGVY